jgi:hypothetical protein
MYHMSKHDRYAVPETSIHACPQVLAADMILLNKCDLVSADAASAAEQSLATLTTAKIVRCTRGRVPVTLLMDVTMQVLPTTMLRTAAAHANYKLACPITCFCGSEQAWCAGLSAHSLQSSLSGCSTLTYRKCLHESHSSDSAIFKCLRQTPLALMFVRVPHESCQVHGMLHAGLTAEACHARKFGFEWYCPCFALLGAKTHVRMCVRVCACAKASIFSCFVVFVQDTERRAHVDACVLSVVYSPHTIMYRQACLQMCILGCTMQVTTTAGTEGFLSHEASPAQVTCLHTHYL